MAKFYGMVGYIDTQETAPGVYTEVKTERYYYGDINRITKRYETAESLNDNLVINNEISIVADSFAYENFHAIRYVEWNNTLWKVKSVEVMHPRLKLNLGGVYNG